MDPNNTTPLENEPVETPEYVVYPPIDGGSNGTNSSVTVSIVNDDDDDDLDPTSVMLVLLAAFVCVILMLCICRSRAVKSSKPDFRSYHVQADKQEVLMDAVSPRTQGKTMGSPGGQSTLGYAL